MVFTNNISVSVYLNIIGYKILCTFAVTTHSTVSKKYRLLHEFQALCCFRNLRNVT